MALELVPMDLESANAFVEALHRHSYPAVGHKFSQGAVLNGRIVGVAIIGRQVNRVVGQFDDAGLYGTSRGRVG